MAIKREYFDRAVGESAGNGGDLQILGNDIATINGKENQVYLAFFGGNVEQSTASVQVGKERFDWWGNNLLFGNNAARQYNSNVERTLNTTALNSAGRVKIENAATEDLKYLTAQGAKVTIVVTIIAVNTVQMNVQIIFTSGASNLTIITFGKKPSTMGDFSILDFNSEDFLT